MAPMIQELIGPNKDVFWHGLFFLDKGKMFSYDNRDNNVLSMQYFIEIC